MGIRIRKTITMGPMRFTLSKSGIGCSIGIPGYRKSLHSSGRIQTTISLPGTGISHVKSEVLRAEIEGGEGPEVLNLMNTSPGIRSTQTDVEPTEVRVTTLQPTRRKSLPVVMIAAIWGFAATLRYATGGESAWLKLDDWFLWGSLICLSCIACTVIRKNG